MTDEMDPLTLAEKLKQLPAYPGCYMHKDKDGVILYIGKALNLKNRVKSYFQRSSNHSPKTRRMVSQVTDIDWVVTDSELEALILECNLIKKHQPRYNVRLRDDKHYPYLMLTTAEKFPRLIITRKVKQGDGNRYFGPFTNSRAVTQTLTLVYRLFPLVTCRKVWVNRAEQKPCLYYHMGRCPEAPCAGLASEERYGQAVADVELFLSGRQEPLVRKLKNDMEQAAERLEFERAAKLRDQVNALETIVERQKVVNTSGGDQDVMAVVADELGAAVQMFFIRGGKLIGQEHFLLDGADPEAESGIAQATSEFLKQYYQDATFVPSEILLPRQIEEMAIIESWLRQKKGAKVSLHVPERGEKRRLLDMASTNAELVLKQIRDTASEEQSRVDKALLEISTALGMQGNLLTRIEAYDNSNIQGRHAVGAMVVFDRGKPRKDAYRKFKIEQSEGDPNDFAMMKEMLGRRFAHMKAGNPKFLSEPDLILVDGGKGQVTAALEAMHAYGYDFPLVGLAKQFEQLWLPGAKEPIELQRGSAGLFLVQRIRDEVHRFAITYHRNVRGRAANMSLLDEVPGIGPTRRRALLRYFGSLDRLRTASIVEISKVPGMNLKVAQDMMDHLKSVNKIV